MNPILAVIIPLGTNDAGLIPGYPLPTPPVHPSTGPGFPTHPIVIPPGAVAPGVPTFPIVLPDPPGVDNALPGVPAYPSQGLPNAPARPSHPIVYPPGLPDNSLPATPGLPPLHPAHPISGLPSFGQLPAMPPVHPWLPGHGPGANLNLPDGSVLLIPVPSTVPVPTPPEVIAGSVPYIAWAGKGKAPIVVWLPKPPVTAEPV